MEPSPTGSSGGQPPRRSPRKSGKMSLAEAKLAAKSRKPEPVLVMPTVVDRMGEARDSLSLKIGPTGVTYDTRMVEHRNLWDNTHPERPERFEGVLGRCTQLGLLQRCTFIQPRLATLKELKLQHTPEHITKLESICNEKDEVILENHSSQYDSIYFHPSTYNLARLSAGSVIELVESILEGKIMNGMAIVRPPGHHAGESTYCGYCFFNNVAIAAKHALESGKAKKILIVDFDVHHGQASQEMFYGDPRVLYFSTHRYEDGLFWPNLIESNWNWVGSGEGHGYNMNVPLNKTGMGNNEFLAVWMQLLLPMAYGFAPDLVLISAGYDAAIGCPEGRMLLEPSCYPHLIHPLLGLAKGKLAVVLEGGYCIKSLSEAAALSLRTLLGDPCPLIGSTVDQPMPELVNIVLSHHSLLREQLRLKCIRTSAADDDSVHKPKAEYLWTEPLPLSYPTRDCHPLQSKEEFEQLDKLLDRLILTTDLAIAKHKVGYLYDEGMMGHRNQEGNHPERPERISRIHSLHEEYGLVGRCVSVQAREATTEELALFHGQEHIDQMGRTSTMPMKELSKLQERYNSVFLNNNSNKAALLASGGLLNLVREVLIGNLQSGIGVIRPPGHHAEEDYACGFCLYNNVVIAAKYAMQEFGLKRILLLDWDVHHGNGVQHAFYSDPRVLYISLHRYDGGSFFPCSREADYDKVGHGPGLGYNVNIPFSGGSMGDEEYMAAFINVILPIAYEFGPELVLVSAGFDAAVGDPLGGYRVTPQCYGHMTHLLKPLANGRLILTLEGGYNLESISYSMASCTRVLLGDPLPALQLGEVKGKAMASIQDVISVQSEYWASLSAFDKIVPEECPVKAGDYLEKELMEGLQKLRVDAPPSLQANEHKLEAVGGYTSDDVQILEGAVGGCSAAAPSTIADAYSLIFGNEQVYDGNEAMYLVEPLDYCPHLDSDLGVLPPGGMDTGKDCEECGNTLENWVCLSCFGPHCSRYVNKHMQQHFTETGHRLAISCSDLSIWCYGCDAYIDCVALRPYKSSAHRSKFGTGLP